MKKKRTGRGIHPDHCGGSGSCRCKNYELSGIFEDTGNIFDKDTLTDEEKKIDQELSRLVFEDSKGSKLFFELQVLDRLDEHKIYRMETVSL